VDSSGLASLVDGWKEAGRRGARFVLTGLNERLKRVLHVTGLARVFGIATMQKVSCRGSQ
jgi:anti-anti-sigma factor